MLEEIQAELSKITHTIEGYEVKSLRFIKMDNVIVGLVKCPIWGKDTLHNGFVSCKWRKNGSNLKDKNRTDLNIKLWVE
jgi:hypothetical protein